MAAAITKTEAKAIRDNLALRYNMLYSCYEIYTSIHGSGIFRWMKVTDDIAEWYKNHFGLTVSEYLQPSINTGGILSVTHRSPPIKGGNP